MIYDIGLLQVEFKQLWNVIEVKFQAHITSGWADLIAHCSHIDLITLFKIISWLIFFHLISIWAYITNHSSMYWFQLNNAYAQISLVNCSNQCKIECGILILVNSWMNMRKCYITDQLWVTNLLLKYIQITYNNWMTCRWCIDIYCFRYEVLSRYWVPVLYR